MISSCRSRWLVVPTGIRARSGRQHSAHDSGVEIGKTPLLHAVFKPGPPTCSPLAWIITASVDPHFPGAEGQPCRVPNADPGLIGPTRFPAAEVPAAGFAGLMWAASRGQLGDDLTHLNWGACTWCTTSTGA